MEAFLQRFLQHVLPKGFVKVRYYGFLGSAKRKQLQALRQELQQTIPQNELAEGTDPAQPTAPEPPKTHRCPKCGQAMILLRTLAANRCRSP